MKFGLFTGLNHHLRSYGAVEGLQRIKDMGYDYVEPIYSESLYTDAFLPQLKSALAQVGIPMLCYSSEAHLEREDGLQRCKTVIDQAAFLGVKKVHHTLVPSITSRLEEEGLFEKVVSRLKESAAYAADKGIRILVEPQGLIFNGIPMLSRLFDAVEGHNVFYCSDIGNGLFVDEDPIALARAFLPITEHVHVKDLRYAPEGGYKSLSGKSFGEVRPGTGELPLKEFLALYQDSDLTLSMEYDTKKEDWKEALETVKALAQ